jgi:hypothetical protein
MISRTGVRPYSRSYLYSGGVAKARKEFNKWRSIEFKDDPWLKWVLKNQEETRLSLLRAQTANLQNLRDLTFRAMDRLYEQALESGVMQLDRITDLMKEAFHLNEEIKCLHMAFHRDEYHPSDADFIAEEHNGEPYWIQAHQQAFADGGHADNIIYLDGTGPADDEEWEDIVDMPNLV